MKYSFYVKLNNDLVHESRIYDENDIELSRAAKGWETDDNETVFPYRHINYQVVFVEHSDTLNNKS